ncbi:MAG: SIMPL domain-containing protein [Candidatus Wildermuthbacteria bacterium]|nr:SIMPL domain-containing protein [Candidatus Wildermuthbacteria bacterium]
MTEQLKKYLSIAGIAALGTFSLAALQFGSSYSRSVDQNLSRSFSATAQGEVTAIPDVATFSFGVLTQGNLDLGVLQEENAKKTTAAIEYIKSKSVESKDISTQSYSVEPRYQYYNCGNDTSVCPPPDIVGYTVSQHILVKARDFAVAGDLLAGVVKNGANSVSQLSFSLDDPEEAQNEARAKAIAKAKTKAQMLAKAGGFSVGRLLSIQENQDMPYPYPAIYEAYGKGGADSAPVPSIEPGSQKIRSTITLVYEIR